MIEIFLFQFSLSREISLSQVLMCLQPFRSPCWSSPGTPGRPWVPSVGNQWPVTGILNFSFCFVFTAFPFGVTSIMANNTAFLFVKYQGGCLKRVSLKEVRQFSS